MLDLLRAVHEATKAKPPPYWASIDVLDLDQEGMVDALVFAAGQGWVSLGGMPPHSIKINATGINQISKPGS